MKINKALVFGAGYVGTSLAVLLSQEIKVLVIDNNEDIVNKLNNKESPIEDLLVDMYLNDKSLDLQAQTNIDNSICNYDVANVTFMILL